MEQVAPDTKADRNGIRSCMFSCGGDWVVSVAQELCIWRVCLSRRGRLELRLHQRLAAVCGAEGLCAAAVCCRYDSIAVGSRDGVLGLWTKLAGWPADMPPPEAEAPAIWSSTKDVKRSSAAPWKADTALFKPMMQVKQESLQGLRSAAAVPTERRSLRNSEWFVRSETRSISSTSRSTFHLPSPSGRNRGGGAARASNEKAANCSTVTSSPLRSTMRMLSNVRTKLPDPHVQKVAAFGSDAGARSSNEDGMSKSTSMPELPARWRSAAFECEDVLGALCSPNAQVSRPQRTPEKRDKLPFFHSPYRQNATHTGEREEDVGDGESSVRKAMLHATRGLVHRISLEPHKIC